MRRNKPRQCTVKTKRDELESDQKKDEIRFFDSEGQLRISIYDAQEEHFAFTGKVNKSQARKLMNWLEHWLGENP